MENGAKQCPWCGLWALKDKACNFVFACGLAATSPLVKALVGISVVADVGAPIVAVLDPPVAAFVGLVPSGITCALDIAEGKTVVGTVDSCITQMNSIVAQGTKIIPGLSGVNLTVVTSILNAVQQGVTLFEQQFPPTVTAGKVASSSSAPAMRALIARAYTAGAVDSPNPATAKVKPLKLGARDRAAIAKARKHAANIAAALKAREAAPKKVGASVVGDSAVR